MVVLRSGREINPSSSCSSIADNIEHISEIKGWTMVGPRAGMKARASCSSSIANQSELLPDLFLQFAEKALNYFNQNNPQKYKLFKRHSVELSIFGRFTLYHINFTAENTDIAAAPVEMFFTELTESTGVSVRLCVSLGPEDSLSGDKSNGCYFCREDNNVWHPKGGGFVRGADALYKTVQRICDTNQNNAIPDHEKCLHRLKQVYRSLEPKKEREYISEQVDDASLYASEALNYYNQRWHIQYELVKPGFVTRVILPTCLLFHVNFTAKDTDDATAPEEIFFAEITSTSGVFSCKMCTILDPKTLLSGDETGDKTNGCYYCHEFNNVRHPIYGGFVRGGDSLYISEEELRETQLA